MLSAKEQAVPGPVLLVEAMQTAGRIDRLWTSNKAASAKLPAWTMVVAEATWELDAVMETYFPLGAGTSLTLVKCHKANRSSRYVNTILLILLIHATRGLAQAPQTVRVREIDLAVEGVDGWR